MSFTYLKLDLQHFHLTNGMCGTGQAGRGHQASTETNHFLKITDKSIKSPGVCDQDPCQDSLLIWRMVPVYFLAADQFHWVSANHFLQPWGLSWNCSKLFQDTAPKKKKNNLHLWYKFHEHFFKIKYFPLFTAWIYPMSPFYIEIAAFILLSCNWNTQEKIKQHSLCNNKVQLWLITS